MSGTTSHALGACGCRACRVVDRSPWWRQAATWSTVLGGLLFAAAVLSSLAGAREVGRTLYLLSLAVAGVPVAGSALGALRRFRLDMNVLMLLAVLGALYLGEWFEAALVVLLFSLSESLERYNLDRSRRSIARLMELAPQLALVRGPSGEVETPVERVEVGAVVVVRPGDRLPLDGRILSGHSYIDQSPITGESLPVSRAPGQEVFAGTINGDGLLAVEVTRLHHQTTLARIIHLVEEAEGSRAPAQKLVDRFAARYTPAVVAGALLLALLGPVVWGGEAGVWLYRSMALLLIACPCALVISTPVSVLAALSRAARAGVLVKGGVYLELAGRVDTVLLDKTGTLTTGRPRVAAVAPLDLPAARLLQLAAGAEYGSEHPLGRAVVQHAREAGIEVGPPERFRAHFGHGVEALLEGQEVLVGNPVWVSSRLQSRQSGRLDRLVESRGDLAGHTLVAVAAGGRAAGLLALSDSVRPAAARAVRLLAGLGVSRLEILTGDGEGAATLVATAVGIERVRYGLLPADKVAAVRDAPGVVAMVGDGINDAPALAAADLGIALGVAGTDAALETADVALMADDLTRIPFLLGLGRATRSVVVQNVVLALGIKALAMLAAASGHFTLWMAVLADTGAALLVVSNGLRLLGYPDLPGGEGSVQDPS